MKARVAGAIEALRCYRDLHTINGTAELPRLVDFAFAHCIAPSQVRAELLELAEAVARLKPDRALEVGTSSGGTLFLLCRLAAPAATIISLDLPCGLFGGGYAALKIPLYKRFAGQGQKLYLLRGDSHRQAMLERVRRALGEASLDYLFIDGDHTYAGVKQDFEMYAPLVRRGGLIALHDINPHPSEWGGQVPHYWQEIRGRYPSQEIIAHPKQGFGIGILQV